MRRMRLAWLSLLPLFVGSLCFTSHLTPIPDMKSFTLLLSVVSMITGITVSRQGMSADTCLLEFGHLLQMGDDLVGSQMRPLIPDSHISASSYFLDHPEHGFGQMWRSRLDCEDSCWVASDSDKNPYIYIQWRFPSCREIRAVATKGRPDTACWAGASVR